MAIYKPSNCVPFLDTWDLTKDQNISFEINTNNNIVNGYKIKVLDSKNNLIFEGKEFSPINSDGIAYNGDIVEEPLIVRVRDINAVNLKSNIIYYDGENYWVKDDTENLKNFSNGYINQPYKWQIVLAQGLIKGSSKPTDDKYYDMTIVNGTVIGSTPNRIQGAISEYIYKDYFVQLIGEDKKTIIGNRALITSYDHTYGHIAPKEGWFTQDDVDKAFYFQIFKNTNQPEYINTNRIVSNVTGDGIKMEEVEYDGVTSAWGPDKNTSKYYFIQTYSNVSDPGSIPLGKYCNNREGDVAVSGNLIAGETTLLVRGEGEPDSDGHMQSKYNGVFLFVSAEWKASAEGSTNGTLTITWQRPAMADTWAEFLGQSFFVLQTSENWDSNAKSSGEINSTPLAFYPEKAIEIYPNNENKTLGEVYKTNEPVSDKSDTYRIYIRPFIGIEDGMRFKWIKYNQDGSYRDKGFIDYNKLDTERWCIEYSSKTQSDFTPNLDTYTFVSYFKTSDENPFYGYSDPEIEITNINGEDITDQTNFTISNRTIDVMGNYSQVDNKMWKSFQWSLYDFNYNTIQYDDVKYSGEISARFIGLEKDHNYELTLSVEDELGRTFKTTKNFIVDNVIVIDPFGDDIRKGSFNCALHSIDVSVAGSYGVIEEGIFAGAALCSNNTLCSNNLLCSAAREGTYYKNISIGTGEYQVIGTLMEPTTGDITLNFTTTIKDNNFIGDIIGIEFGNVEDNPYLNKDTSNDLLTVFLPDLVKYSEAGLSRVNENRYKIYVLAKIATAQNTEQEYTANLYDISGVAISNNNWIDVDGRKICFGYQANDSKIEDGCDYIIMDEWFDEEDKKYYRTFNGKKNNFSSNYSGIPAKLEGFQDEGDGIWYDKKLKAITQPNGQVMQVITDNDNIWNDDINGEANVWSDTGYGSYEQVEVLNKTGRELLNGATLNFNLAFKNYIYKAATPTNVYAQCVVSGVNGGK